MDESDLEFMSYADLLDLRDAIDRRLEQERELNDKYEGTEKK
jgi:hypothetical protein